MKRTITFKHYGEINLSQHVEKEKNFRMIKNFFERELAKAGYVGVFGVASFKAVYCDLMPIQKGKLKDICGNRFYDYMKNGSIICIGIAFPEYAIDCIGTDIAKWNIYAKEYQKINRLLNSLSMRIAEKFGGIPIPATIEGDVCKVTHVEEYYEMTVSHRVIAENAGLGWRGKNELIVNKNYSCALRFASIITDLPLIHGKKVENSCGTCAACLEICSFLKNKEKLKNYRENCRRYMNQLMESGLLDGVCGKCIKACYRYSIFRDSFKLR